MTKPTAMMTGKMTTTKTTTRTAVVRVLIVFGVVACLCLLLKPTYGFAQTASQEPAQNSAEKPATDQASPGKSAQGAPADHQPTSIGGALAKETREAEGEEEEENANLKHSSMVQKLAKVTGMSVHQAHLVALGLNFAIIVVVIFWAVRKYVPGALRARTESIQKALEEARTASQEAGQRLADIEKRLQQMDAEIAKMQASAEKDAEGEESRIAKAAEEELKKVVLSAEQEIAAATKLARRELASHTADLALALARKQINVDSNTDQVLVRNFASKLASRSDGGKDGR
jgi:F0F1-type ATP synthase membrane subunit b/b'